MYRAYKTILTIDLVHPFTGVKFFKGEEVTCVPKLFPKRFRPNPNAKYFYHDYKTEDGREYKRCFDKAHDYIPEKEVNIYTSSTYLKGDSKWVK